MTKKTHPVTELVEVIYHLEDQAAVKDFLRGILTDKELVEIAQRLQIIKRLKQGMSQREVADELGVGVATVTRGSKELQKGRFKNV